MKEAKVDFIDAGPGKPVGINQFIGRRPYLAFGNSDGDQQILEWTAAGEGLRYMGLVHHTDAVRECAYAITGGRYTVVTESAAGETGVCSLPGGKACDAAAYYAGTCSR